MRVACCGLTTLDVIQQVDALPGPDQKVQAHSALIEFGGPAANAAFTAVALDCSARLISAVVPPVAVVDTVGAGDVLHGAALVALARGASFAEALRAAVPIASRSCSHPGAHAWAHVTTEG